MLKRDFIKLFDGLPDDAVVCLADFNDGYYGPSEGQAETVILENGRSYHSRKSIYNAGYDNRDATGDIILIGNQGDE